MCGSQGLCYLIAGVPVWRTRKKAVSQIPAEPRKKFSSTEATLHRSQVKITGKLKRLQERDGIRVGSSKLY